MTSKNEEKEFWSIPEPDGDQAIWRYMDFTQFMSILQNGSLWFTRVDQFEDPFEGKIPEGNIKTSEYRYADTEIDEEGINEMYNILRMTKQLTFVNCWHENDFESAAMWDLYLSNNQGIAIRSTPDRVKDALNKADRSVTVGKVDYRDYNQFLVPENNLFAPSFFKRRSFEHENEIRFAFLRHDAIAERDATTVSELKSGEDLPIYLDKLIESIYISPTAPNWFRKLVSDILTEYGITADIVHSDLYETK